VSIAISILTPKSEDDDDIVAGYALLVPKDAVSGWSEFKAISLAKRVNDLALNEGEATV
jgi:hypothetical protein